MRWIHWFGDIGISDVALVGGKNASLDEMRRELTGLGVPIPDGFAISAEAFSRISPGECTVARQLVLAARLPNDGRLRW